jgi:hypothetical protein
MNNDAISIHTYIDDFSKGLKNTNTRRQYRHELEVFTRWVGRVKKSNAIEIWGRLDYKDVEAYLSERN